MALVERDATAAADSGADSGVGTYRVVDPMDETGRMTVKSTDGETRTVVGALDERLSRRLADRARGATVRIELSRAPSGTGHVVTRVKAGALPPL